MHVLVGSRQEYNKIRIDKDDHNDRSIFIIRKHSNTRLFLETTSACTVKHLESLEKKLLSFSYKETDPKEKANSKCAASTVN